MAKMHFLVSMKGFACMSMLLQLSHPTKAACTRHFCQGLCLPGALAADCKPPLGSLCQQLMCNPVWPSHSACRTYGMLPGMLDALGS